MNLKLLSLKGFSSREINFHLYQFFSNFLRYSLLNFLSFYPYNIFAIYFSGNSLFLKSCPLVSSNLSYLLTSILILSSKSVIVFFISSKSFFLSYMSCFIFHSSFLSTFTSFSSSTLCSFTSSLYC